MFEKSKSIKRIVSISAAAVCMLSSLRIAPASYIDDADAASTLTAFQITADMKVGWNLGNTMDAKASDEDGNELAHAGVETEEAWGCPKANQTLFNALKAKGFNTVRIPTTWFQHLDDQNNIDPAWLARVHEVVDYAYKNGMYVILNVHHENWINRGDLLTAYDEIKPKLLKIWSQLAAEFKDYDQHLIFECMNEPRAVGKSYEWWSATPVEEANVVNKLNADFVNLIRGTDGPYAKTRLLMLPGYVASSDKTFLNQIVMPDDDYCAVSIHAYTPYNFTMNTNEEEGAYHDTFTKQFSNDLAYNLQNFRDIFIDKGIPVVIGEMGTSNFGNTQARVDWTTQYFTTTKKYGIPCVLWDNNIETNPKAPGECHAYINRETGQWLDSSLPIINKMMEIMNDSSIVWGSEGKMPEPIKVDHQDLSQGKAHISSPVEIDAAKSETYQNTTPGEPEISWNDLKGKEVAIKYTGETPVLAFSDKEYKGWTELKPYTFSEDKTIAYYLVDTALPAAWDGDLGNVKHMQARTDGVTTIQSMVILDAPDVEIDVPVDKTKKFQLEFDASKRDSVLVIKIKGDADTETNGCVGYNGNGWKEVKWSAKTNGSGEATIEIALKEFPETVKAGELQIWYNPESMELVSYSVENASTTTTQPTTSEVTTTTSQATTTSQTTAPETTTTTETTTTAPVVSSTTSAGDVQSTTTATTTSQPVSDQPSTGNTRSTGNGDANCDNQVNLADAVWIMQCIANPDKYQMTADGEKNADVTGNDGVTNKDALTIQKFKLGLVASLPVNS